MIEAGDISWDIELFTGTSDWKTLLDTPTARLSPVEKASSSGRCKNCAGCSMSGRFNSNGDLPAHVWDFLKQDKFFGIIIPRSMAAWAIQPMRAAKMAALLKYVLGRMNETTNVRKRDG